LTPSPFLLGLRYFLHGQLICLYDKTQLAVESIKEALKLRPGPDLYELLARIRLGQGNSTAALTAIESARRIQSEQLSPARRASALMLHLQIVLALAATPVPRALAEQCTGDTCSVVPQGAGTLKDSPAPTPLPRSLRRVWLDVRSAVTARLTALSMSASPDDMLLAIPALSDDRWRSGLIAGDTDPWMAAATADAAQSFQTQGFAVLHNLVPAPYFEALQMRHAAMFGGHVQENGLTIERDDPQRRRSIWGEELSLFVGVRLLPVISRIAGRPLVMVYTFGIHYDEGGDLKPHVDRAQNTYSVSLNLGLTPDTLPPWPLWVSPTGQDATAGIPISLAINDALFYGGTDHVHFRHPLKGGTSMQVIFGFRDVNDTHCNSQ
jgi:hypothetical protein